MASDGGATPSRRLPVYFLVDTSSSMAGPKIAAVSRGLETLRREILTTPPAARMAYMSIITYADGAYQTPLAPVAQLTLPALTAGGATALGAALRLLNDSLDRDLIPSTPGRLGDYNPLVFLLTDGAPTDNWEQEAQRLTARAQGELAAVVALAVGSDADMRVLRRITPLVLATQTDDVEGLDAFFQRASASIKAANVEHPDAAAHVAPELGSKWIAATIGTAVLPGVGTVVGAILGGMVGSLAKEGASETANKAAEKKLADEIASDQIVSEYYMVQRRTIVESNRGEDGGDGEEVVRGITLPDKPKPDLSPPVEPAPEQERAGEAVLGGWDTPTMSLPGREEAPPAPPPVPMPAPPAASPPPPPPPPAPMPPQAPIPPGAPIASPPPPAPAPVPPGAPPPPAAPMPAPWGQPPASQPPYPSQAYPPQPQPGYAPPPQAYPPPAGAGYGAPPAPPYPPMPQMAPPPQGPGGYGYPGPYPGQGVPQPGVPVAPVAVAEQVTFTAYHLREIAPQVWEPLYVYIALDTPQAQAQVGIAAQQALAGRSDQFRPAQAAQASWLRRGTQLNLVPNVSGFQFNPPEMTVTWEEDVQQHLFRMRAATARPGLGVNGSIQVFTGPLLRADIPISIFVRQAGMGMPVSQSFASAAVRAYRRVFASYSHKDTAIVESCETAAEVTGDRYLRDVTLLRSGEQWDPRLIQAIGEADLFQLFWSEHAAQSHAVATEWRHALSMQPGRGNFIRPVYWSKQPYTIPPELRAIHFERLSLARLGWGKARIFFHNALGLG